eukprot:4502061-Pyramimonas_sp.AAC.1
MSANRQPNDPSVDTAASATYNIHHPQQQHTTYPPVHSSIQHTPSAAAAAYNIHHPQQQHTPSAVACTIRSISSIHHTPSAVAYNIHHPQQQHTTYTIRSISSIHHPQHQQHTTYTIRS